MAVELSDPRAKAAALPPSPPGAGGEGWAEEGRLCLDFPSPPLVPRGEWESSSLRRHA